MGGLLSIEDQTLQNGVGGFLHTVIAKAYLQYSLAVPESRQMSSLFPAASDKAEKTTVETGCLPLYHL
jgi:hypothetical protein